MSDRDRDIQDALHRIASLDGSAGPPTWDHLRSRRRRRRVRRAATIGAPILLGAALMTGVALSGGSGGGVSTASGGTVTVTTGSAAGTTAGPDASGGQRSSLDPSCVTGYSAAALRGRAFAFDGTVLELDDQAHDPKAPKPDVVTGLAVFKVNEWFKGGSETEATVWMQRDVHVGDRLLVTGQPRWGGAPLDDAIAWECGFTGAYAPARATEWRATLEGSASAGAAPQDWVAIYAVDAPDNRFRDAFITAAGLQVYEGPPSCWTTLAEHLGASPGATVLGVHATTAAHLHEVMAALPGRPLLTGRFTRSCAFD